LSYAPAHGAGEAMQ